MDFTILGLIQDELLGRSRYSGLRVRRRSRRRICDSRHKLAKATTINWPRMLVLVELFDHFRSLYNDKVAASPGLQA
jgi:hypothetical protein